MIDGSMNRSIDRYRYRDGDGDVYTYIYIYIYRERGRCWRKLIEKESIERPARLHDDREY